MEFPHGVLVTLVGAHLTPDAKHATGTLSVLPAGQEAEVLHALRDFEADLKDALAGELRMRRVPDLHWRFDDTQAYAADIEADLHELRKKGEL